MNRESRYCVWNVTLGYVEHVGTEPSCRTWVRNVRDSGFARDSYRIYPWSERPGSARR